MDSSAAATTATTAAAAAAEDERASSMAICLRRNPSPASIDHFRLLNGGTAPSLPSSWFEIRLFYVRISPCAPDAVPPQLTLSHLRREMGVALEINGARVPPSEPTTLPLRRDRVDRDASEVTYVSTDGVRLTGPVEFEVRDGDNLVLCGSLERLEPPWSNGAIHHQAAPDKDPKTGWSINCYSAALAGSSAFIQPKLGISSPSMEVYVAGCCSGFPLILTQTLQLSPRKKATRQGMLDAIPEDDETTSEGEKGNREGLHHRHRPLPLQVAEGEADEYDAKMSIGHSYYPEGAYYDEDGQLSWFNAGVRVGVGIGLGMCLGVGIGVGLLMKSYQTTTRTFRRRFF